MFDDLFGFDMFFDGLDDVFLVVIHPLTICNGPPRVFGKRGRIVGAQAHIMARLFSIVEEMNVGDCHQPMSPLA
jgi:hypothetical protein